MVDTDHVIGVGNAASGTLAQGDIVEAGGIAKRLETDGRVVAAGTVQKERSRTDGRVVAASGIVKESTLANGSVMSAGGIVPERYIANRRVEASFRVEDKRVGTNGRILEASCIAQELDQDPSRC